MLTEKEQAFIQWVELSKDLNLYVPEKDLKKYYEILQKEYFDNLTGGE